MYFLFGRSIPRSLSRYFVERAKVDGHHVKFASMGEFEDTEPFAEIDFNPKDGICVIFQSIAKVGKFNSSSNYMQMLALADNLRRNEAQSIWAVNPLAGFMRQDDLEKGKKESLLSELSGRLMRESGIVGMSTVEAHSDRAIDNYQVGLGEGNVININPNKLFRRAVEEMDIEVSSVANPDLGADSRAAELAEMLGADRFMIKKKREKSGTYIRGFNGEVGDVTALLDDMASSLGTAKNAIELIYDQGSKKNILLIAHPIMTGKSWDNLAKLIKSGKLDHVVFLPTIARENEFNDFEAQYGQEIAGKVVFLNDAYNEMIYEHVVNEVANHPMMEPAA